MFPPLSSCRAASMAESVHSQRNSFISPLHCQPRYYIIPERRMRLLPTGSLIVVEFYSHGKTLWERGKEKRKKEGRKEGGKKGGDNWERVSKNLSVPRYLTVSPLSSSEPTFPIRRTSTGRGGGKNRVKTGRRTLIFLPTLSSNEATMLLKH